VLPRAPPLVEVQLVIRIAYCLGSRSGLSNGRDSGQSSLTCGSAAGTT
jgi:hypothetical protein